MLAATGCGGVAVCARDVQAGVARGRPLPIGGRGGRARDERVVTASARAPPRRRSVNYDAAAPPRLGKHASPGWSPSSSRPSARTPASLDAEVVAC
jgi:hypothetical protein